MIVGKKKLRFKFKSSNSNTVTSSVSQKDSMYGGAISTGLINANPTNNALVLPESKKQKKVKIKFSPISLPYSQSSTRMDDMIIENATRDKEEFPSTTLSPRPLKLHFKPKPLEEPKAPLPKLERPFMKLDGNNVQTGMLPSVGGQNIIIGSDMTGLQDLLGKNKKKREVDGYAVPDIENLDILKIMQLPQKELRTVDAKYPLTPRHPKKNERVFSYAHIYWDFKINQLVYDIIEPKLTVEEQKNINEIKEFIQEKLDINFATVRKKEAIDYIKKIFDDAISYFRITDKSKRDVYIYYIVRDFIGLSAIDPLINDDQLEDISCDGVGIPIYIYHRNPKFGSLRTNIFFKSKDELDSFVMKISERCGKNISVAKPLLDGTLPDGSRVQATLGSDIARLGSNFTIRKFTEDPLTPVDLIEFGTMDLKTTAFLWMCVDYGASIMISGGTATGKTSMLNVLSLFIRPQLKIISIEDTAELRLPHPHWIPEVARAPIETKGEIDMYELLRESLRQRPDYIIVGEVRGREAYVLFQQMSIGHPSMSTVHAENLAKLFDRLTTAPISLPPNLLQNLDIIVFLKRIRRGNRVFRRISEVEEVTGFDKKEGSPISNTIFEWNPEKDVFDIKSKSALLKKISIVMDMSEAEIKDEIEKRAMILRWMVQRNIKDYRQIGKVINMYYASPEYVIQRLGAEVR